MLILLGGEDRICLINDETQMTGRCMRFSGDYVRKTRSGALHYVGRKDDMVKRNGRRLHLHEIEKVSFVWISLLEIYSR